MSWPRRLVAAVLVLDLLVLLAYAADTALGHPVGVLKSFFDPDEEQNLPAWWSSAKFLSIGLLLGAGYCLRRATDGRRAWSLALAAAVAMGMSLDETATMHERLGVVILPYKERIGTVFARGGPGAVALVPLAVALALLIWRMGLREYFAGARSGAVRAGVGLALLVGGAAGVELLRVLSVDTWWHPFQVLGEEGLEFLGATLMLWGVLDLVGSLNLRIAMDPAGSEPVGRPG